MNPKRTETKSAEKKMVVPEKITIRLEPQLREYAQQAVDMGARFNFSKMGNAGIRMWLDHGYASLLMALLKPKSINTKSKA